MMEIKITHTLSAETQQLIKELIETLKPAHAQSYNQVPTERKEEKPKSYLPFTEPDLLPKYEEPEDIKETKEVDISTIRALVKEKADEGKKNEIKALLAEHGAQNVSQLKPGNYSVFYAHLQNL